MLAVFIHLVIKAYMCMQADADRASQLNGCYREPKDQEKKELNDTRKRRGILAVCCQQEDAQAKVEQQFD